MSGSSREFISADSNCVAIPEGDFSIEILGIHDGAIYQSIEHSDMLTSIPVMSPDGSKVAAGSRSGAILIWSVDSGELEHSFAARSEVRTVAFSPDGRRLMSGGTCGTVTIWSIDEGRPVMSWTGHVPPVNAVAFSPDGRLVASGGQDKTIWIWDTETGQLRLSHPCDTGVVTALSFSPDGTRLACGTFDETAPVRVLDLHRGAELWRGTGHSMGVTSVTFSADSQWITSGSQDMTLVLWEAQTGRPLRTLEETNNDVAAVAFAPDGSFLMALTQVFEDFLSPVSTERQWGAVVWDPESWSVELRLGAENDEGSDADDES